LLAIVQSVSARQFWLTLINLFFKDVLDWTVYLSAFDHTLHNIVMMVNIPLAKGCQLLECTE